MKKYLLTRIQNNLGREVIYDEDSDIVIDNPGNFFGNIWYFILNNFRYLW